MAKVINEMQLGKYHVMKLDEPKPIAFSKIKINGKEYDSVIAHDAHYTIAFVGDGNFIGEEVEMF